MKRHKKKIYEWGITDAFIAACNNGHFEVGEYIFNIIPEHKCYCHISKNETVGTYKYYVWLRHKIDIMNHVTISEDFIGHHCNINDIYKGFHNVCLCGNYQIAKFLINGHKNERSKHELYEQVCNDNHIEIVELLNTVFNDLDQQMDINKLFSKMCYHNKFGVAKAIKSKYPNCIYETLCYHGVDNDIKKWIENDYIDV